MADDVGVNQTASYTVAADVIGTIAYQRVKLEVGSDGTALGDVGATNPLPVTGTVSVSQTTVVSGTVSVSGAVQVSGAVSISAMPAVSGTVTVNTIAVGFSVNALVTGAVSVSAMPGVSIVGIVPVTTQASVSVTGLPVWLNPTQAVVVNTIAAGFSVNALVTGPVSISAMPAVSVSVSAVLGTVVTLLGTVAVNVVAGGAGGGATTSAPPSISETGQIVWVAGGQGTTVNPIFVSQINAPAGGGGSVTTAVPSVSATGQIMWIVGGQSTTAFPVVVTGTVTAGAGTTVVSIQNIVGVVTAASVSVTGLPVWLNPTQPVVVNTIAAGFSVNALVTGPVSISEMPAVSISVSAVLGTVVTLLGTVLVSQGKDSHYVTNPASAASGMGVYIVGLSTTALSGVTGPVVWLGASQTIIVSTLISGAVSISAIAASQTIGTIIAISGVTAVSAVSTIVTILGTQLVSEAKGSHYVTNPASAASGMGVYIVGLSTTALSGVTGPQVWLGASQSILVGSILLQPVLIMLSSTVVGSNTTLLFSVHTGATFVTTGASFWVVPAGKVFRVMAMNMVNVSSAVLGRGNLCVIVGTAAASLSVTSTVGIAAMLPYAIQATTNQFRQDGMVADIAAGTTVGVAITGGTTQSILGGAIQGYLF
jgi:hypothetical protein